MSKEIYGLRLLYSARAYYVHDLEVDELLEVSESTYHVLLRIADGRCPMLEALETCPEISRMGRLRFLSLQEHSLEKTK